MTENWLAREALLIGEEGITCLRDKHVAVVGLGGVGYPCAESLCRAGVGALTIVDHDTIDETNLNRQLIATREVLGQKKVQVARERLLSINPSLQLRALDLFYQEETSSQLLSPRPDYIVDCIDTVSAKLTLAQKAKEVGIPLLICLGTGNRLDPTALRLARLEETAGFGSCPLARVMRREAKKRGLTGLKVLCSEEAPIKSICSEDSPAGRHSPGSISFVPPVAGMILAGQVVRDLLQK